VLEGKSMTPARPCMWRSSLARKDVLEVLQVEVDVARNRVGRLGKLGARPGVASPQTPKEPTSMKATSGCRRSAGGGGKEVVELIEEDRVVVIGLPEGRLVELAGREVAALRAGFHDPLGRGPTRPGFADREAEGDLLTLRDPALGGVSRVAS